MVRWIHPSYRDLVVGELAADAGLRSRFLEVADFEGVKLCVSQAGGSSGERRQPLLSRRCLKLIDESDGERAVALVKVLRSAMVDLEGDEERRVIAALASCCEALKVKWDRSQVAIKQELLRELFDAGILVDPLPVAPKLEPTWRSAVSALRETLKVSVEKSVTVDASVVLEWSLLTELLTKNEPRFLRQVNFPKALVGDITQLLASIEADAETDIVPEDPDDIWSEADRMSTMAKALTAIANSLPDLRDRALQVRSKAASQENYLSQQYREASASDEPYDEGDTSPRERTHVPFDLDALFKDL
jgi:hypothetical protein